MYFDLTLIGQHSRTFSLRETTEAALTEVFLGKGLLTTCIKLQENTHAEVRFQ